jgi:Ca2+-binding RTX toxin-like protein
MATITGTSASDTLTGTSDDDALYGLEGDDILEGGDGNDLIDGGEGADHMTGGNGDDVYYVDNGGDVVVEAEYGGWDEVRLSGAYLDISAAYVESVDINYNGGATVLGGAGLNWMDGGSGNDWLEGRGGDDLLGGNLGADRLDGGAGNDHLDGGQGNDVMIGGSGDDVFRVQDSGDVVTEAAGEGVDTVLLHLSTYTLPANVENLDLRYALGTIGVTGNSLNNLFIVTGGTVTVYGGAGIDTVSYQSTQAVMIDLANYAFGGSAANHYLNGIENVTGSPYADDLRGNGSANILDGGAGADTLTGRNGSDIYYVDDAGDLVVEAAGGGTDEVRVRGLASYTLPDYVEKLTNATGGNFTGTGNALANELNGGNLVDTLYGGAGHDVLNGGSGNDLLYGEVEHDTLNGGLGADTMHGGTGNDLYIVDNAFDVVVENSGAGTDQVLTTRSTYTLGDHVENLTFNRSDGAAVTGTGNNLGNIILGQEGGDSLDGAAGADELRGNGGDDMLTGGAGDDLLIGGAGADLLDGGYGGDMYRFFANDTGLGAAADRIANFDNVVDRIDLSAIDADSGTAGDQAFAFIGGAAFSGAAGELRVHYDGVDTWIQGDFTGDGVADFEIVVSGAPVLGASDFLL